MVESVDESLEESEWVPRITSRGIECVDSSVCREVPWDDWRVRSSCEGFAHSDCDPLTTGLSFVVMVDAVVEREVLFPLHIVLGVLSTKETTVSFGLLNTACNLSVRYSSAHSGDPSLSPSLDSCSLVSISCAVA